MFGTGRRRRSLRQQNYGNGSGPHRQRAGGGTNSFVRSVLSIANGMGQMMGSSATSLHVYMESGAARAIFGVGQWDRLLIEWRCGISPVAGRGVACSSVTRNEAEQVMLCIT